MKNNKLEIGNASIQVYSKVSPLISKEGYSQKGFYRNALLGMAFTFSPEEVYSRNSGNPT